jgi:hypothetical protein
MAYPWETLKMPAIKISRAVEFTKIDRKPLLYECISRNLTDDP